MKPEDKAVVQQLCDALKKASITVDSFSVQRQVNEALDAGKALLEQPEPVQEPVAWTLLLVGEHNGIIGKAGDKFLGHPEHYQRVDVYTTPPAQPAVPWSPALESVWGEPDHGDELTIAYLDGVHTGKRLVKREWVGLTDEEKEAIYRQADAENWHDQPLLEAVEAKLREKNGGQE